jgi:hypothetical protein
LAIASLCILGLAQADEVRVPDPWKSKEYSVLAIEGRFAAYIGLAPIILDSKLRDKGPKTYLEAIERFGPAFTSRLSSSGLWEWHFDDGMIYRVHPKWSGPLSDQVVLKLERTYLALIHAKNAEAQQVGAGQPATRSELESEGGDKPQPESEGRSR